MFTQYFSDFHLQQNLRVCVCVLTEQDTLSFALSKYGFKYSEERLGQLLLQVVLCVDGNGVLQHIDRVLQQRVEGAGVIVMTTNERKTQGSTLFLTDRPLTSCTLLLLSQL